MISSNRLGNLPCWIVSNFVVSNPFRQPGQAVRSLHKYDLSALTPLGRVRAACMKVALVRNPVERSYILEQEVHGNEVIQYESA